MLLEPRLWPASKVSLWCGSQHGPEHFNEGTYAVVTDCDSDLRDRFPLCEHLKGSKQPCLLSPAAKRHTHLSGKRTHESSASHSGNMRSEEHTSELQSHLNLVCRLLLEKKKEHHTHHAHHTADS